MWPNKALVGSMLGPKEFGSHYAIGSSRYYHGVIVFAEIDPGFRNDYFPIDRLLEEVKPKIDGTPKRTKFISCYRVLEHLDFSAFGDLYITSVEGKSLRLQSAAYEKQHDPGFLRTFQEITPLNSIVLSHMTPPEFGQYITDPEQPKGAPKVMFTQIDLDIDAFLRMLEANPFHDSPIPNIHPTKLRDQIMEIKGHPEKRLKGISLDSVFGRVPFLRYRTGFWFAAQKDLLFYPIPAEETLRTEHYDWYRSLEGQGVA